jgi:putative ABC transport system substrate-binding protein
MKRRAFIAGLGAVALPLAARAQQIPVVGYLHPGSLEARRDLVASFLRGLAETGFVEGRNVAIEYRWADDHIDRLPALAADLVRRQVAVIATPSITAAARAAKAATQSIPIVFLVGSDPVQAGLVASLNRPGGNLTGVTVLGGELAPKRLEILHETVPSATLVAHLINPTNPVFTDAESREVQAAARILGLRVLTLNASSSSEIEVAFERLIQEHVGALLISGYGFFGTTHRNQLVALAARHRIPTMYDRREVPVVGGLISYGADIADAIHQTGVYTGRILKGEKAADLPVQQSTKFELVINMKTAKALGVAVPETLLATADKVIE